MESTASVLINEREVSPTSDYLIDFLVDQKRESAYFDFKTTISVAKDSDFPEIAKHIFAFANYGGGWLLIGWKEDKKKRLYEPVGLDSQFNFESASFQEKFNSYSSEQISFDYKPFSKEIELDEKREEKNFAIIYIPPSKTICKPIRDGTYSVNGKTRSVFKKDEVLIRRGTQSVNASSLEENQIRARLKDTNYHHSLLSGSPDRIEEKLESNLFQITKFPQKVFIARARDMDTVSRKVLLRQEGVFPEWIFKFRDFEDKIVTLENLSDEKNPHRKLIESETIQAEDVSTWLKDPDKKKIIIGLLRREFVHYAFSKGLYYFEKAGYERFYFPCAENETSREESWNTRFNSKQFRQVAKKAFANQLHQYVYYHHCFSPSLFEYEQGKFYFRISPSFIITSDGRRALSSMEAGNTSNITTNT